MATAPNYTLKRKKIYKGEVAPTGTVYIQIRTKHNGMQLTQAKHIHGHLPKSLEKALADDLYRGLQKKYNLPPLPQDKLSWWKRFINWIRKFHQISWSDVLCR